MRGICRTKTSRLSYTQDLSQAEEVLVSIFIINETCSNQTAQFSSKFKLNADDEIFDPRELLDLLVSTDYQQAIHPNGFVLSDEELDSLLDRSNVEDSFCNSVRKAVQPS
uniref:Uncharacterized protein n=1 Tax=Timema douglasi TaxID=61478 RepID=A0A7R8Z7M7_TIMDO|nr:unnamed protein product [Timema douglasi]